MALPKISQPLFELTIPSTGKKVRYRPFTVKEEKIQFMELFIGKVMMAMRVMAMALLYQKVLTLTNFMSILLFGMKVLLRG